MKFEVNTNITNELFDEFYNGSALTLEGLDLNDLEAYINYLNDIAGVNDDATIHIIKGESMNNHYSLFGRKAYPDDLHIIVIKLSDFANASALVFKRFEFGGRWFDDVVDNNSL